MKISFKFEVNFKRSPKDSALVADDTASDADDKPPSSPQGDSFSSHQLSDAYDVPELQTGFQRVS